MGTPDGKSAIELTDDSRAVPVSTTRNLSSLKSNSEDFGTNYIWRLVLSSIKAAFFSDKISFLLPCGPLAMLVDQLSQRHVRLYFIHIHIQISDILLILLLLFILSLYFFLYGI